MICDGLFSEPVVGWMAFCRVTSGHLFIRRRYGRVRSVVVGLCVMEPRGLMDLRGMLSGIGNAFGLTPSGLGMVRMKVDQ